MKAISCFCFFIVCTLVMQAQHELKGKVIDGQSAKPMPGVTVKIKGATSSVTTNNEGHYSFTNLIAGNIVLVFTHIGYETLELPVTLLAESVSLLADITLTPVYKTGDDVVVSASRRPEKITEAPASIQVIGRKQLEQFTGSNTFELLSKVQGVEFVRTGVDFSMINARGMNNAFNNKILQIVDGRNSTTPLSASLPMQNGFTLVKDDIERIEVVLGPQTALYGPNAHNAIINFIARDPRTSQGTTVALSAGNRYQFNGRIRQAAKVNNKWAYKLTGEYAVAREFEFYDTVYAGGGPNNYYGPIVGIPERNVNFDIRHIRGEAHVYYSVTPNADIIISAGGSNNNFFNTHTAGRLQVKGMKNGFLQGRYVSKHLFLNVYNTWATIGNSFNLNPHTMDYWNRTHSTAPPGPFERLTPEKAEINAMRYGIRVKENSERFNGEAQYNTKFEKAGLFLITGFSYQKERPHAYGIALVDSFELINITQYGTALQLEKSLPLQLRFVGAARWDHHSNFGNFFSPKLGMVKKIGDGTIRVTWGRAYSMPTIIFQYGNLNNLFYGNGEGITYIPNGTKIGDSVRRVTSHLRPEEVSTWELGYKGAIAKNLYVDINGYYGKSKNFFSPSVAVPGRALLIGDVKATPLFPGQEPNDTLKNASFVTVFNFGTVKVYGVDVGVSYHFNKNINIAIKYSWIGSDITKGNMDNDANKDGYVAADEKSLNTSSNRAQLILNFQDLCKQKLFVNFSARYVEQYDFYSGNQIGTKAGKGSRGRVPWKDVNGQSRYYDKNFDWGPLGGFTTIDVGVGYKFNQMVSGGVNVTNLFNTEQREFVGSPSIGRLIMFELKVHVPNSSNK
ncbi:MAG TPA: TonB-dependent receptor [Chitinophagaceae bacterium]|nr:TonB-dependent receptor [Chitinophagaceae bacterium]